MKRLSLILAILLCVTTTGCGTDSKVASRNLAKAAESYFITGSQIHTF